jgi:hypothetical protein
LLYFFYINKADIGKIIQVNYKVRNLPSHDNSIDADYVFEAQIQLDTAIRNFIMEFEIHPKDKIVIRYINSYWT